MSLAPSPLPTSEATLQALQTLLSTELTTVKPLSPQVVQQLADAHSLEESAFQAFLEGPLNALEPYEVDLLLSPQFTPKQEAQLAVHAQLGGQTLTGAQQQALEEALLAAQLTCQWQTAGLAEPLRCPLPPLMLPRVLRLLKLTLPLPQGLQAPIATLFSNEALVPVAAAFSLLTRGDVILQREGCLTVAQRYAEGYARQPQRALQAKTVALLGFIKTYAPQSPEAWPAQLQALIKSCTDDMAGAMDRSYHHHEIRAEHGGSAADAAEAAAVRAQYQALIEQAQSLLDDWDAFQTAVL
jgi:hypothetical protein